MTFLSQNTRFSRHFWVCYQAPITFNDVCSAGGAVGWSLPVSWLGLFSIENRLQNKKAELYKKYFSNFIKNILEERRSRSVSSAWDGAVKWKIICISIHYPSKKKQSSPNTAKKYTHIYILIWKRKISLISPQQHISDNNCSQRPIFNSLITLERRMAAEHGDQTSLKVIGAW